MTDTVPMRTKRIIFAWFLGAFIACVTALSYTASASPEREIEITRTTCDVTCSEPYTFTKEETVMTDLFFVTLPLTIIAFLGTVASAIIAVEP